VLNHRWQLHRDVLDVICGVMNCLAVFECRKEDARRFMRQTSLVSWRVWFHVFSTTGNGHTGGRRRARTSNKDQNIAIRASRNLFSSAQTFRSNLERHLNQSLYSDYQDNTPFFSARRSCIRVPLNQEHWRQRLVWAQNHVKRTVAEWTPVFDWLIQLLFWPYW
jgi:hypothetical protein